MRVMSRLLPQRSWLRSWPFAVDRARHARRSDRRAQRLPLGPGSVHRDGAALGRSRPSGRAGHLRAAGGLGSAVRCRAAARAPQDRGADDREPGDRARRRRPGRRRAPAAGGARRDRDLYPPPGVARGGRRARPRRLSWRWRCAAPRGTEWPRSSGARPERPCSPRGRSPSSFLRASRSRTPSTTPTGPRSRWRCARRRMRPGRPTRSARTSTTSC